MRSRGSTRTARTGAGAVESPAATARPVMVRLPLLVAITVGLSAFAADAGASTYGVHECAIGGAAGGSPDAVVEGFATGIYTKQ